MADSTKNKDEILTFLKNNSLDPNTAMGNQNKFEAMYFIGDKRMFSEETRIGIDVVGDGGINVHFFEINHIEFETSFKISEQAFHYNDENETLNIIGTSSKFDYDYKIVINSIYLD